MEKNLDLITIGRSSVDLYGEQIGGRLEDMGSFKKYIGGSPTNIAAGGARLGLKTAVITKVGDEHMGRFIREELMREGVDVSAVTTDPERLTALVLLGIRDQDRFPLIFYRENCADMGLTEDDIDPEFIARAKCLCATGTHLSNPITAAAVKKAVTLAQETGAKTALDIDYRPNLWGLGGHDKGESRYVASTKVTDTILATVGLFDLIVGTEEEFHIAGGSSDTLEALRNVRKWTKALLVCKRGPMGAVAFEGDIPKHLEEGETGPGFSVDVFNVLGAGDGFMAGFLKGWLTGENLYTSLKFANACGAFAVSRHGCTPSYPSREELEYFFRKGSSSKALRKDFQLEQIHWSTTRRARWKNLTVLSFENTPSKAPDAEEGYFNREKIEQFKGMIIHSLMAIDRSSGHYGIIFPVSQHRSLIDQITGQGVFMAKSVGTLGLDSHLEIETNYENLSEWPLEHTVKIRMVLEKTSDTTFDNLQESLRKVFRFARKNGLEFALELSFDQITTNVADLRLENIKTLMKNSILPDFWILDYLGQSDQANVSQLILARDPYTQGIISKVDNPDQPRSDLCADISCGQVLSWRVFEKIFTSWLAGNISSSSTQAQITKLLQQIATRKSLNFS